MTRSILSAAFLFFLSAFAVAAQNLVLRSGEHGDYTRLVIALPQNTQWRVDNRDSVLRLNFSTRFSTIDVSDTFRRIDRRRISDINVQPENRGIDIVLACNCGFRAFVESGRLLVIDVSEEFPSQEVEEVAITEGGLAADEDVLLRDPGLLLLGRSTNTPFFLPLLPGNPVQHALGPDPDSEAPKAMPEVLWPAQQTGTASDYRLGNLPAEIANAAAQGLLIPRNPLDPAFNGDPVGTALERHPNINTLAATEMPAAEKAASTTVDGQVCPQSEFFDVPRWGHPAGFTAGLAEWRQSITQEFDRIDGAATIGLARHYLHYGFGKEALAALTLLPQPDPKVEHLKRIARIVDAGHDPLGGDQSWMMACDGPVALWAVLSSDDLSRSHALDIAALRLAFEALPQALKQYLGPQLATRLAASGDTAGAEAVLSSVERGKSAPNPALQLAQANISADDRQEADGQLSDIVSGDSELSPLALVALVDSAVAADRPMEQSKVDLIAAYLFEHRGNDLSRELDRALVLALAFSGQFVEALDRLARLEEASPDHITPVTRSQIITRLLDHADDVSFLTAVLGRPAGDLPAPLENRVAERILDLGFAERALEVVIASAEGADGRARRIIRAKAALRLDEPVVAEAELMGLSGEDVVALRAEARRRQGDFSPALAAGQEDMTEQRKRDMAWLSGSAALLETTENSSIRPSAEETDPLAEVSSGLLGQAESLIDNSSETRVALQDLLSRFPVQTDGSP